MSRLATVMDCAVGNDDRMECGMLIPTLIRLDCEAAVENNGPKQKVTHEWLEIHNGYHYVLKQTGEQR